MFADNHRGYCCGINELRGIQPGDLTKGGLYDIPNTGNRIEGWFKSVE